MYITGSFEDGRLSLKHHLCSMKEDEIKVVLKKMDASDKGSSKISFINPYPKLRLSQGSLNMAIEGKHFEIKPDGKIIWKF